MRKNIDRKHKALIENAIRECSSFRGNEDLMDIVFDAVYKKSYLLIDAIRDIPRLKRHLATICTDCMQNAIREKQRYGIKKPKVVAQNPVYNNEIVSVKKRTVLTEQDEIEQEMQRQRLKKDIINLKEEIQRSEKYDSTDFLIDPLEFCPQKRVSEYTIEKLLQIVKMISNQYPKKRYNDIFALRYIRRYNQTDIAKELKISQVELSKRFVELIRLTRENI